MPGQPSDNAASASSPDCTFGVPTTLTPPLHPTPPTATRPPIEAPAPHPTCRNFLQAAALRKLGLTLAVDSNAQLAGAQLLATVAAAERERAASSADAPLGEWEVMRVKEIDAGETAMACRIPGCYILCRRGGARWLQLT